MDSSPTALFESYEQDFSQFIDAIRQKLENEATSEVGGTPTILPLCISEVLGFQNSKSRCFAALIWNWTKLMKW